MFESENRVVRETEILVSSIACRREIRGFGQMGRRRGRSEDFVRMRWGGVVGFGRKFSGLLIAEVGGVGGREKLASGSVGGNARRNNRRMVIKAWPDE